MRGGKELQGGPAHTPCTARVVARSRPRTSGPPAACVGLGPRGGLNPRAGAGMQTCWASSSATARNGCHAGQLGGPPPPRLDKEDSTQPGRRATSGAAHDCDETRRSAPSSLPGVQGAGHLVGVACYWADASWAVGRHVQLCSWRLGPDLWPSTLIPGYGGALNEHAAIIINQNKLV